MAKGAFPYTGKSMSSKKFGSGSGKMSGAHGTNGQSKNNNMSHNTSNGTRVGAGTRTFKHNGIRQFSGETGGPKHAKQPSGHKSLAKGGF